MNIFAVTVTYGNRFYLLKQVVDRALTEGVQKVIVVDNKSDKESREQLKLYEQWLGKDKIKVLYLDDNCGSAGGFKRGLEEAYTDASCDYILVLDDDNLVGKNSISKILNVFSYLERLENNYMLSFYRDLRDDNKKIVETGWIKRYLPNNFLGFNFLYQLKNKFKKGQTKGLVNFFPLQPIEVTAMGGLFFHKSILNKIGYPNQEFYLYADDHDFTYRFTKDGGMIFLCSELNVTDIDCSTISKSGKEIGYFDEEFPEFKIYYGVRNHTYLSKYFIENKLFFYGNMCVVLLLYLKKLRKTPKKIFIKRYKLVLRAINDGLNNRLGKIFDI